MEPNDVTPLLFNALQPLPSANRISFELFGLLRLYARSGTSERNRIPTVSLSTECINSHKISAWRKSKLRKTVFCGHASHHLMAALLLWVGGGFLNFK